MVDGIKGVLAWIPLGAWRRWVSLWGRALRSKRTVAAVAALSLWMGAGGMAGSSVLLPAETGEEVYGEPHWFVEPDSP